MIRLKLFIILIALLLFPNIEALSVEPEEILNNQILEERARDISKKLRCLVCQNQSIDESEAALAKDLRIIVRERLEMGDSNNCLLYTSPSPRDLSTSRMPSSA